jgi:hypothetical protein
LFIATTEITKAPPLAGKFQVTSDERLMCSFEYVDQSFFSIYRRLVRLMGVSAAPGSWAEEEISYGAVPTYVGSHIVGSFYSKIKLKPKSIGR